MLSSATVDRPRRDPAGEDQADRAARITAFLREYAGRRLNSRLIDERRCIPPSAVLELGEAGLFGLQIEQEHGGQALGHRDTYRVMELLAAIDPNLTLLVSVHNAIGVPPIRHFADPARKPELLDALASGRALATVAASEPGAGSDVRAITTTARRRPGGGYVLNGGKSWISLGSWAGHVNVFAQLEDTDGRPLGITGFLVDSDAAGYVSGEEALTVGMKGIPQNHLTFQDLRLQPEALLGAEGQGLAVAQAAFMAGRALVAATSLGAMKRSLQIAHRYATRRQISGGVLFDNGRTQQILTDSVAATRAVEILLGRIADALDRGETVADELYFAAKILGSELMWRVVDSSMQMLGARGYVDSNVVGQFFRDYRLLRIFEGATEAVTGYLGSRVRKDPDAFCAMLAAQFGDSSAIAAVEKVLVRLRDPGPHADQRRRHLLSNSIGELAAWGALTAAVTGTEGGQDVDALTAEWCRQRLYEHVQSVRSFRTVRLFPSDVLSGQIVGYTETIGDAEQELPGARVDIDPMLAG